MLKKLLIGGGVVVALVVLFHVTDAESYVKTSASCVKDSVKDAVPIEFQLKRARGMVRDIVPEVRKNMHVIAREEVEVERLAKQIDAAEKSAAQAKSEMMRLKSDLEKGEEAYTYSGRVYTVSEVKKDLSNRFERYQTSEATLESLKAIHDAREKRLQAARKKLENMLASRSQLLVEIENLEARLQMVSATQAGSEYHFDDSQLGRVKELVSDLRTRLSVAERLVNAENRFHDEIPLEEEAPEDIVDRVAEYFGGSAKTLQPSETDVAKGK